MVDASIIHAPGSTKNQKQQRDQEMSSTRKGRQYYFGMKVHIGRDIKSKVIHSATVTAANEADMTQLAPLLREDDQVVFAAAGYASDTCKRGARALGMSVMCLEVQQSSLSMEGSAERGKGMTLLGRLKA